MSKRGENLEYLERLIDNNLPEQLIDMKDDHLDVIKTLVDDILDKDRAGFDKFFESISDTLKYIPNFIVLAVINKYIEPPISARITEHLPVKSAVSIAKGLSTDYICDTAVYLDSQYAANLLVKLPKKKAGEIVQQLIDGHPLKMLDILEHAESISSFGSVNLSKLFLLEPDSLSEHRRVTLQSLKELS